MKRNGTNINSRKASKKYGNCRQQIYDDCLIFLESLAVFVAHQYYHSFFTLPSFLALDSPFSPFFPLSPLSPPALAAGFFSGLLPAGAFSVGTGAFSHLFQLLLSVAEDDAAPLADSLDC
jgi:hypothetical protein